MISVAMWRLGVFVGAVLMALALERARPALPRPPGRGWIQLHHIALMVISTLLVAVVIPGGLVAWALQVQAFGWGVLTPLPFWAQLLITVLLLDLAIYLQHALMHRVGWLWALHRVHHTDDHLDALSALRFHPLEILLSALYKAGLIALLGAPWQAVALFEIALSTVALFSHSNIALPPRLERIVRQLLVTPVLHRWHHEYALELQRSQYGSLLSFWDRLFATLRTDGSAAAIKPGLAELPAPTQFWPLLKLPFQR
jgi:sterol desaturase/sphingolipid hydroxylase (fatty acid hydroxylase superfamily)